MYISSSLSPRQCLDRYDFCAGQKLPDKEFCCLRIVIVTAAVHRGFGRRLPYHQVTNFLDLPALGKRQPPYMVL
ncbi:signal anchor [Olea europaea subsp. europaea]|uniref:Signal anchor n=2 Tax=Olea europaea subsp. europaea TaxID=158383 RepID=A0A8S0RS00_OLEEU|nr:signal anchor [Olea europaea subsp. europaea]